MATSTTSASNKNPSAFPGLPRYNLIPTNILQAQLMSGTSLATDCFAYQRFSGKLQAFMIGYVNQIYSNYPIYD